MEWFLQLADKVGVPLALFAVTIIIVLMMQRSERKDVSSSIKVVNDITLANHSSLTKLQKEHRILLYNYGKLGQALTSAEKNLQILNDTYQDDKGEWERERQVLQKRIDDLTLQLEEVRNLLADRDNELKILRKNA